MNFKEFFQKNRINLLFSPLLVIFAYAALIFNSSYCADLEYVLGSKGSIYNWNELGRYTLILLKKIFFTPYNVILESVLFVIFAYLTVISLAYLLYAINNKFNPIVIQLISCAALIFPTYSEQFYFKFQAAEVMFGIFLAVLSGIFLLQFINEKKIWALIVSVILNVLSFGIYQSMLNIVLVVYIGIFTCISLKKENEKTIRAVIVFPLQFLVSFALNKLVCLLFCREGSYFADKIMWKQYSFDTCFHFVKHYFRVVLLGERSVYAKSFIIALILSFVALIFLFIKEKAKAIPALIGVMGLAIAPFTIAIIQGFEPDSRTQLALPFSIAFLMFFYSLIFIDIISEYKYQKRSERSNFDDIISETVSPNWKKTKNQKAVLSYIIILPLSITSLLSLFQTCSLSFERMDINKSDNANIRKIASDLKNFDCSEDSETAVPVIIIGTLSDEDSSDITESKDYVLISVFNLDADTEPIYFFSTNRILSAMDIQGYRFKKPNVSTYMEDAYSLASDMPSFPSEGYIQSTDNFILVHLK